MGRSHLVCLCVLYACVCVFIHRHMRLFVCACERSQCVYSMIFAMYEWNVQSVLNGQIYTLLCYWNELYLYNKYTGTQYNTVAVVIYIDLNIFYSSSSFLLLLLLLLWFAVGRSAVSLSCLKVCAHISVEIEEQWHIRLNTHFDLTSIINFEIS